MKMMRTLSAAAVLALLVAGTAAAQSSSDPNGRQVDKTFVQKAAKANTAEVREARLELDGSNAQARRFAQRMIRDHGMLESELASVANRLGDTQQMRSGVNAAVPAGRMPGTKYLTFEAKEHERAIALFEEEAQRGRNPLLRSYAEHAIPILQHQLATAIGDARSARIGASQ